jgi:hypothetical protein
MFADEVLGPRVDRRVELAVKSTASADSPIAQNPFVHRASEMILQPAQRW